MDIEPKTQCFCTWKEFGHLPEFYLLCQERLEIAWCLRDNGRAEPRSGPLKHYSCAVCTGTTPPSQPPSTTEHPQRHKHLLPDLSRTFFPCASSEIAIFHLSKYANRSFSSYILTSKSTHLKVNHKGANLNIQFSPQTHSPSFISVCMPIVLLKLYTNFQKQTPEVQSQRGLPEYLVLTTNPLTAPGEVIVTFGRSDSTKRKIQTV